MAVSGSQFTRIGPGPAVGIAITIVAKGAGTAPTTSGNIRYADASSIINYRDATNAINYLNIKKN